MPVPTILPYAVVAIFAELVTVRVFIELRTGMVEQAAVTGAIQAVGATKAFLSIPPVLSRIVIAAMGKLAVVSRTFRAIPTAMFVWTIFYLATFTESARSSAFLPNPLVFVLILCSCCAPSASLAADSWIWNEVIASIIA